MELLTFIIAILFIISWLVKFYLHEKLIRKTSARSEEIITHPFDIELMMERARAGSFFPIREHYNEEYLNRLKNHINKLVVAIWALGGLLLNLVAYIKLVG